MNDPNFLNKGLDGIINSALQSAYIAGKSAAAIEDERLVNSLKTQRQKLLYEIQALQAQLEELRGKTKGSDLSGEVHDGAKAAPKQPLVPDRTTKYPWNS